MFTEEDFEDSFVLRHKHNGKYYHFETYTTYQRCRLGHISDNEVFRHLNSLIPFTVQVHILNDNGTYTWWTEDLLTSSQSQARDEFIGVATHSARHRGYGGLSGYDGIYLKKPTTIQLLCNGDVVAKTIFENGKRIDVC